MLKLLLIVRLSILSLFSLLWSMTAISEAVDQQHRIQALASFSILADITKQIGGDLVEVESLIEWDEDGHVFQASPRDIRHLKKADLFVMNGLGFEGWVERVIDAAGYTGKTVVASDGINPIRSRIDFREKGRHEGDDHRMHHSHQDEKSNRQDLDPHAWHSITAVKVYAKNIKDALIELDPENAVQYEANSASYVLKLEHLDQSFRRDLQVVDVANRNMVVPHNAFAYLAREYDLNIYSLQAATNESAASAAQLAQVIRFIRSKDIRVVFTENVSDSRLAKRVSKETNASIGGELISDALSRSLAPSYLDMMAYNLKQIEAAFKMKK